MADLAVWHRLYTHAASDAIWETTGARIVDLRDRDAGRVLPEDARAALDDLLKKCAPRNPGRVAYAVRHFRTNGELFTCLVASYDRLVCDAAGRQGLLNHARVVRIPAGEPLFEIAALLALAEAFPLEAIAAAPEANRLRGYLETVENEAALPIGAFSLSRLEEIPAAFLVPLLVACIGGHGRGERTRFLLPELAGGSGAMAAALGSAAVPLVMQHSSSWGFDVQDGCPLDVVLSTAEGHSPTKTAAAQFVENVTRYLGLLQESPEDFVTILRNPDLSTAARFGDAVQRAGRIEMKKNKGSEPPPLGGGSQLDAQTLAEIDRQFRALEASLRSYIDQRFSTIESSQPRGSAAASPLRERVPDSPRQQVVPFSPADRQRRWLIGGVILMLLLGAFGAWRFLRGRGAKPRGEPSTVVTTTGADERDPVPEEPKDEAPANLRLDTIRKAVANGEADGQWAVSLKNLIENHGGLVAASLRNAADGVGLDDDAVTAEARQELRALAGRVEDKASLSSGDRGRIRELLLDYVAALSARDPADAAIRVDGVLRDVTPQRLANLKGLYRVSSTTTDRASIELQSEMILRWMEADAR